jgi:hypothetical protein
MPVAVKQAVENAAMNVRSEAQGKAFVTRLEREGRLFEECWSWEAESVFGMPWYRSTAIYISTVSRSRESLSVSHHTTVDTSLKVLKIVHRYLQENIAAEKWLKYADYALGLVASAWSAWLKNCVTRFMIRKIQCISTYGLFVEKERQVLRGHGRLRWQDNSPLKPTTLWTEHAIYGRRRRCSGGKFFWLGLSQKMIMTLALFNLRARTLWHYITWGSLIC